MNIVSSNTNTNNLPTSYLNSGSTATENRSQSPSALQQDKTSSRLGSDPAVKVELSDQAKATLARAEADRKVAESLNHQLNLVEEGSSEADAKQLTFKDIVARNDSGAPIVENGNEVLQTDVGFRDSFTRQDLVDYVYESLKDYEGMELEKTLSDPEPGKASKAAFMEAYNNGTLTIQQPSEIEGFEEHFKAYNEQGGKIGSLGFEHFDQEKAEALVSREFVMTGVHIDFGSYVVSWGAEK